MAEYSRLAKGSFTSNGGTNFIRLPFVPDFVQLLNFTAYTTPTATWRAKAYWDVNMGQGAALYETITASTLALVPAATTTLGVASFSAGLLLQYGPSQQIIGATAANPIVFNVTAHGYVVGDIVEFVGLYQSSTTGMSQISGMPFRISAVGDADHFSVVWPGGGSNYTALSASPAGAFVKKILYPFLYAPGVAFVEAITTGSTTTVTTTAPHNFVVGQQIAFNIPSEWGTTQLNETQNSAIPSSSQYYYVTSVSSSTVFVCNANSSAATAFNTNQTIASVKAGLSFPQVKAVGDVNTGGVQYSGGNLYPSPVLNGMSTINGPAIQGAYVNNTSAGFAVGPTVASVASQVWYYRAFLNDISA